MAPIVVTRTIHIAAHRSAVWAALTQAELISEWFGDDAHIDLRVGGDGDMNFEGYGMARFIVEEVDEPNTFAYRWPHGADQDPHVNPTTLVRFTLEDAEGGTSLTVVETGWETFGDDAAQFSEDNNGGWASELAELKDFLERQDSV